MAVTNLELINRALRELNVISEGENASPEQGSQCLAKLNGMMEVWRENGIDFGWYAQSATSGTAPVPQYAELAVHTGLAILCASQYGASVSPETEAIADRTYNVLLRQAINNELDNVDMSHLPEGSGHFSGVSYNITTDA